MGRRWEDVIQWTYLYTYVGDIVIALINSDYSRKTYVTGRQQSLHRSPVRFDGGTSELCWVCVGGREEQDATSCGDAARKTSPNWA
jgi:hypothetical protein